MLRRPFTYHIWKEGGYWYSESPWGFTSLDGRLGVRCKYPSFKLLVEIERKARGYG